MPKTVKVTTSTNPTNSTIVANADSAYNVFITVGSSSQIQKQFVHREFLTSGSIVTPTDFDSATLVFRDNLFLVEGAAIRGYTNNVGTGITLSEPARTDNPEGGEWITVLYTK